MSLVNSFLEETPLTSTKNKFLREVDEVCGYGLSSLYIFKECISPMKTFNSELASTENRFLLNDPVFQNKDADPNRDKYEKIKRKKLLPRLLKKKKKKRVLRSIDRVIDFCDTSDVLDTEMGPSGSSFGPGTDNNTFQEKQSYMAPKSPGLFGDVRIREGIHKDNIVLQAARIPDASIGFSLPRCSEQITNTSQISQSNLSFPPPPPTVFGSASGITFGSAPGSFGSPPTLAFGSAPRLAFDSAPRLAFRSAANRSRAAMCASGFALEDSAENIPEKIISKMPTYNLDAINLYVEKEFEFSSYSYDSRDENIFANAKRKKMQLLNVVSMALMYSSNLKDEEDNYRVSLKKSIDDVLLIEPEFILKIALYARQELQIRTVSNFLLSYAATHPNARMYLEKYFEASIVLPSDWIEVAEYFQVLSNGENRRPLPAALRRAMKKCFQKFDKYQLAKYNRVDTKKKQKMQKELDDPSLDVFRVTDNDDTDKPPTIMKALTLKALIRTLHIDSPGEHVMCLLEKKYPRNQEEFRSSGLPGNWDPEKSGERMKLPTPETWETRISACGNKPEVWQSLIDHNKLPYMATLRNLKNLITSGISPSHHKKVISNLQNKKSVIKSRQLPMQYFEAYKALTKLQKMIENDDSSGVDMSSRHIPGWKKRRLEKLKEKCQNVPSSVVEEYKKAISKALEISSMNNLHPIPGKTLIICQIDQVPGPSIKAKNYETCIMMGLMCLKACEDCKMCIFSSAKEIDTISLKEEDPFLDVLMKICKEYEQLPVSYDNDIEKQNAQLNKMLNSYLKPQSLQLDHVIFLQMSGNMHEHVASFLHKYRQLVNSDLLYTHVNFNLRNNSFSGECISEKDATVCGSSSSLIKFIAERSTGGQLNYIENIDVKYKLPEILESKYTHTAPTQSAEAMEVEASNTLQPAPSNYIMPTWRTLRIFISSTFKDMMSERDLLIRYVFPELKRRAASVFAKIVEVDLRWGITEADSATRRAAEICLREAQKADIFVGMIGERYGSIYNFEPPDAADLGWVKSCESGRSITELEIEAGALRKPKKAQATAFFYFRNNTFIRHVPKKWTGYYTAEDFDSKAKVDALKEKIRSKKFNIFEGYPCHFAGICDNKPVLAGLEVLGNRVLDDLWKTVQEIQKQEPQCDTISETEVCQQNLIESKKFFIDQKDFSTESVAKKIVSAQGTSIIYGAPGCGKTTFLINLLPHLKAFTVVKFFIGVSPRSRDLSYIIQYLCKRTCQELGSSIVLPSLPADIVSYFPDFLLEASNCCGGKEIIFLIDGLDRLEENDQQLDWLPLILPKRIRVICSASQTSVAFKVLCRREKFGSVVSCFEMPPLLLPEREKIVRNYLSYYRKTLDESAFSNKMMKIVTKKDSAFPFYLQIVCDFLRIYGSFENLESILQSLPSSTDRFFQEIILQMENEFGSILLQTVLTLLCITKEGLEDADLHYILSFVTSMNDLRAVPPFDELKKKIAGFDPENLLSQVKYCSLMSTISTFAYGQLRQESFNLVGTEFEKAVEKFYRNKNFVSLSKSLHCILAAYYSVVSDVTNDGTYKVKSGFALRSLLYHLLNGHLYKELVDLLCNVIFLKAVFHAHADGDLLEYYSSLLCDILPSDHKMSREIDISRLSEFYDFVSRNFHIFHQYPDLLVQQAVNELSTLVDLGTNKRYLLENLSRDIEDYRLATLSGFTKNITAAAGENLSEAIVLGTEDGYIKILDLTARRVVRTIKAHASEITYICCIERNLMCVASVDGTLTVWNTQDFSRISVLRGHRHNVTCCCSDPAGYILYSSGWDNSVRLWSAKDGRSISVIEDFRCPVNWIDHHPQKQQIACGLWNGNIEVWDTVSIQKKTVMPSLNGSVQSLAYTQDGVNIVSSYINSEIFIWSSEEGLKISYLKGHILPVKTFSSLLNDSMFISGSDDCTLKVWSTVHRSHVATINDTKFCPINLIEMISENLLAVAFQNSEIWVIDINNGKAISKIALDLHIVSVFGTCSSLSKDLNVQDNFFTEKVLVFGTQSGTLMMGDLLASSTETVIEFPSKITAAVHNCKIIVSGTSEGDIGMYHLVKKTSKTVYSAHKGFIGTVNFNQCDETLYVLSSGNDNVLKLWKIEEKDFELTLQNEFLNKHRDAITCTVFQAPSMHCDTPLSDLITGSYDNNIIYWEDTIQVFEGLQSSVLKVSSSGDYILGCGNDGSLVKWHKKGTLLTKIPGINQSSAVLTFHVAKADDSGEFAVTLAYVDLDGSIKINKPLQMSSYCSLDGHSKPITSCCGTENKEIVSCSLDGCVNLWKIPEEVSEAHLIHESSVTGLIVSASFDIALSSDTCGNLILWKINSESSSSPLIYAGKKKYDQGFIKGLSWLKGSKFACAVSQLVDGEERYFVHIIQFNESSQKAALCLEVINSFSFEYEISSLDTCDRTDSILVGMKSGNVWYLKYSESGHTYKLWNDWILSVCFYTRLNTADRFCLTSVDGRVKMYSLQNLLSYPDTDPMVTFVNEPSDSSKSSKIITVMRCREELVYCGDSDGVLRIYKDGKCQKVQKGHDGLISGICIIGSYLFTSSLDKTVKGWNLTSFKQVFQFHSSTPVTSLSSIQSNPKKQGKHPNILLFGTTSGNIQMLRFHTG